MTTQGNALAGSLAATLEAAEVQKLLRGKTDLSIAGNEVFFDAAHQKHYVTRLDRNPLCRFSHEQFSLHALGNIPLAEVFEISAVPAARKTLSVPGSTFVSRLICLDCDREQPLWRLRESVDASWLCCPGCGEARPIRGIDLLERLSPDIIPRELLNRPLEDLGFRAGEVFRIHSDGDSENFVLHDQSEQQRHDSGTSVIVAGLGNIGSFLAPHLARMEEVSEVVLFDPDIYEPGQQIGQDVPADATGKSKAAVQAERLRAIRPELRVESVAARIERLPLGRLQNAIVVSCLDSQIARLKLASRAWQVGSPFVDAAVEGGASLSVRTNVYVPGPLAACFECALEAQDYARLEQTFPCETQTRRVHDSPLRTPPLRDLLSNSEFAHFQIEADHG